MTPKSRHHIIYFCQRLIRFTPSETIDHSFYMLQSFKCFCEVDQRHYNFPSRFSFFVRRVGMVHDDCRLHYCSLSEIREVGSCARPKKERKKIRWCLHPCWDNKNIIGKKKCKVRMPFETKLVSVFRRYFFIFLFLKTETTRRSYMKYKSLFWNIFLFSYVLSIA